MRKLRIGEHNVLSGGRFFAAGTVMSEAEAPASLIEAATTGRRTNGALLAVWVEEQPKPAPVTTPSSDTPDLSDLILTMVADGQGKTEIEKALGRTDEYTFREVREAFTVLLDAGVILKGDKPGEYSVA